MSAYTEWFERYKQHIADGPIIHGTQPMTTQQKFNEGDRVIGNVRANRHTITAEGYVGTVVRILDEIRMTIKGEDGREWDVDMDRFDPIDTIVLRTGEIRRTSRVIGPDSPKWLATMYQKDPTALRGTTVYLKRDGQDNWIGQCHKAIIVDVVPSGQNPTDSTKAVYRLLLEGGGDYTATSIQFEVDVDIKITKTDIEHYVLDMINRSYIQSTTKIEHKIKELQQTLSDYEKNIAKHTEALRKETDALKHLKKHPKYTGARLKEQFTMLKNHEMVETAYISKNGNFIALTKDLIVIDSDTNKPTGQNIGRFTIHVAYGNVGNASIHVINRDYDDGYHDRDEDDDRGDGYHHPNIQESGDVCWGANEADVRKMIDSGELYLLTDFVITFLSLFPHPNGSPHTDPMDWLEEITKRDSEDTRYIEEAL